MTTASYSEALLERHLQVEADPTTGGGRSPFERDRDRILYSSAFRALAYKTQVVAATELGYMHNRLTHSLKVAQLGRSMAGRLQAAGAALDPVLVEAACLAHDIGHPPFGHAGEKALNEAVEAQRRKEVTYFDEQPEAPLDGFEGNAQNLRVITRLATHRQWDKPGLHLTRATILASTKYPWLREVSGKRARKWGAYAADEAALIWALEARPPGFEKPIEAVLMDWADDVTYAVHDMEDWFRTGLIPLEKLFIFKLPPGHPGAGREENVELTRFLDFVTDRWAKQGRLLDADRQNLVVQMHYLADAVSVVESFHGTKGCKGRLQATVTDLITYFVDSVRTEGPGIAYDGELVVPSDRRQLCELLKELVWFYVINRPGLAAQQRGQARIIQDLFNWIHEGHDRLLPRDRQEEYSEDKDLTRVVADHIASLTEPIAVKLHGKLSGTDLGAITDAI